MDFLRELHPNTDFASARNFIEEGLLDSFDVIVLISMMNKEYGILIQGENIRPEDFFSVKSIEALIKKQGAFVDG